MLAGKPTRNRLVCLATMLLAVHVNRENAMLLNAIRAELERLQVHAVNLGVELNDDHHVNLRGSLLQYWKLPRCHDGKWLLEQLQVLPDAAGPQAVMNALTVALEQNITRTGDDEIKTQLRLFDPDSKRPAVTTADTTIDAQPHR